MTLSHKQRRFIDEYMIDHNGRATGGGGEARYPEDELRAGLAGEARKAW